MSTHLCWWIAVSLSLLQRVPARGTISIQDLARQHNRSLVREVTAAHSQAERGDVRAAAAHLERAVAIDPLFAAAYANLGLCYLYLGQALSARRALLRAIELDPKLDIAYSNLGVADLELGNPDGAAAAARMALRIAPDNRYAQGVIAFARQHGARIP